METLTLLFVAVAGLIFGSFFNVVIYRLPRGLNLSRPPSACPGCGARIKPYDNVPVLSYLLLRGKCRKCGQRISPVYPAVEALTAARLRPRLPQRRTRSSASSSSPVVSSRAPSSCSDSSTPITRSCLTPITLPGLVLALAYSFFRDDLNFRSALLGAVVGAGFLLLVYGATGSSARRKDWAWAT